jgi:hypothetical protein
MRGRRDTETQKQQQQQQQVDQDAKFVTQGRRGWVNSGSMELVQHT